MFLYLKEIGRIIAISEISSIEVNNDEKMIAEFEGRDVNDSQSYLIMHLKDQTKIKMKGSLDETWNQINQALARK